MGNLSETGRANQFEIREMQRLTSRVYEYANSHGLNTKGRSEEYFFREVSSYYWEMGLSKLHAEKDFDRAVLTIINAMF